MRRYVLFRKRGKKVLKKLYNIFFKYILNICGLGWVSGFVNLMTRTQSNTPQKKFTTQPNNP